MVDFLTIRDRDAWAVIRGYVYQVDLTIVRWLQLRPNEILELERGEDIDKISRALECADDNSPNSQRLLEQIKHREDSLTLRHPAAISALANFVEHVSANPSQILFFRYTTNARIGREHLSQMPDDMPGVEAWERLRQGCLPSDDVPATVDGIRSLLLQARKPDDAGEQAWATYLSFLQSASNDDIMDLVRRFEWSAGNPSAVALSDSICSSLEALGHSQNKEGAKEVYARLFLHVFKTLCSPDRKVLSIEQLKEQITLPTLSSDDDRLLGRIMPLLTHLESRVSALEEAQEKIEAQVRRLTYDERGAANVSVVHVPVPASTSVPPLVTHIANRSSTVDSVTSTLKCHTWTAIHGDIGTGKTQLAILLTEATQSCRLWFRMRDRTPEHAANGLDSVLLNSVTSDGDVGRQALYEAAAEELGNGSLVVLDDIPRLHGDDELSERLIDLTKAFANKGLLILTTSHYPLPSRLREQLPDTSMSELKIPLFTVDETAELLSSYGMPPAKLTEPLTTLVNTVTRSHPTLVAAVARYLRDRNWEFTSDTLGGLFTSEYAQSITDEVISNLLRTITDEACRQLLWRLTVVIGDFSAAEVSVLAAVEPTVVGHLERLNTLLGLWVQRDTENRFTISPLIASVGDKGLSEVLVKRCSLELARKVLEKGKLDQIDALHAILYLNKGKDFNRAGAILLWALRRLEEAPDETQDAGLLSMWSDVPLPEDMDLSVRILLRCTQISICHRRRKDIGYLLRDLDHWVSMASEEEALATMAVVTIVGPIIAKDDPTSALRHLRLSVQRLPEAEKVIEGRPVSSEGVGLEGIIWMPVAWLQSFDQFREWLDIVGLLSPECRQRAFLGQAAIEGSMVLADRLWMQEVPRDPSSADWQMTKDNLASLANRALQLDLQLVWACLVRAQMIVLGDYLKDIENSARVGENALAQMGDDPRCRFVVEEYLGRQYSFNHEAEKALVWLNKALEEPTDSYPMWRIEAILHKSRIVGSLNPVVAIELTQNAVDVARNASLVPETSMVKALAELSVAKWIAGGVHAAFDIWDETIDRLIASQEGSDAYKALFVLCGHVTGYFAALSATGLPPQPISDTEEYVAPKLGTFLTFNDALVGLYDNNQRPYLAAQMTLYAEAVGRDDRAGAWASRGMEMTRESGLLFPYVTFSKQTVPAMLLQDNYEEALEVSLTACEILVASKHGLEEGIDTVRKAFDVEEFLGAKPGERWKHAEGLAAYEGLLPAAFRMSTVALSDPDAAGSHALEMEALCNQVLVSASDTLLWENAARLFKLHWTTECSLKAHIDHANSLQKDGYLSLAAIGYLFASMRKDAIPDDSVKAHISIMPFIQEQYQHSLGLYRRIILPFFSTYWQETLRNARFRFRAPRLVEENLTKAIQVPEEKRAQAILGAIAAGLDFRLTTEAKEWLTS